MVRLLAITLFVVSLQMSGTMVRACETPYTVRPGDSLSQIAAREFRNAFLWTRIFEANRELIGSDPDRILAGSRLILPCDADGDEKIAETPGPESDVRLAEQEPPAITAHALFEVPPFVTSTRPNGGLITDIVATALQRAFPDRAEPVELRRHGGDETSASIVFPLFAAACEPVDETRRCGDYLLTTPVFEMLINMYVRTSDPVLAHVGGRPEPARLCRPAGLPPGIPGQVEMLRADNAEACFAALMAGNVDGVVLNEFTGRQTLAGMGVTPDTVTADAQPLAITMLHAAVRADAEGALQIRSGLDAGLSGMRRDGTFQALLNRHLTYVWAGL
ncbi:LysM peptidoglycan-binding domain-containing protein [Roseobacter sp. S98]|uniref:LysM peptidoglycan-binding domain-containing protein n=1 Tax=Roseobacter algicola (ex Choi et al. 2025) (nom. illeg.) TaxID=3092138 RepID=UPI003F517EDE